MVSKIPPLNSKSRDHAQSSDSQKSKNNEEREKQMIDASASIQVRTKNKWSSQLMYFQFRTSFWWIIVLPLMFSFLTKNKSIARGISVEKNNNIKNNKMTSAAAATTTTVLEDRLRGALWSFMAGDALAAPTHWYYGGKRQIFNDYGGEIRDYTKPKYYLPGSILNKSDLNGGGRSANSRYGGGRNNNKQKTKTIIGDVINHGKKDLWSPRESIHYHATLQAGENTLEVQLARVLMKSIVENGGQFVADHFQKSYINFMMTPGSHNDTYASTCHRMYFANLVHNDLPPKDCPDNDQHNVDTIDGLVLPTIVAMASSCSDSRNNNNAAAAAAKECASVTRKSSVLEDVSSLWSGVVHSALHDDNDDDFFQVLDAFSKQTIRRRPNPNVSDSSTMSACYLSSSLPGMLDMVSKYLLVQSSSSSSSSLPAVWQGLLANANVGGENVHRGSVMGAIFGARAKDSNLPSNLKDGLFHNEELAKEIDDFVQAVLYSGGKNSNNSNDKEEL